MSLAAEPVALTPAQLDAVLATMRERGVPTDEGFPSLLESEVAFHMAFHAVDKTPSTRQTSLYEITAADYQTVVESALRLVQTDRKADR